jgi:predicted N-formylglutamate amidohydrolase
VLGIHSFTPVFKGFVRPWHAGILFRRSVEFGNRLVTALQEPGLVVAANEPYTIDDESDYTVPVHGEARGLDAALVEIRQDLIADARGAEDWAHRLKGAILAIS